MVKKILFIMVAIVTIMNVGVLAATLRPLVFPSVTTMSVGQLNPTRGTPSVSVGAPQRLVNKPGFYFENFEYEGEDSQNLPSGWVSVPNPSGSEAWHVGTLGDSESLIQGTSGTKYAFILGSGTVHDSWAVSPLVDMAEGEKYEISFFYMFISGDRRIEKMEIVILPTQDVTAKPITKFSIQDDNRAKKWVQFIQSFVAKSDGQFCIGLHSIGGGEENTGTLVDDLKITHGHCPALSASTYHDMGEKLDLDVAIESSYNFFNYGTAPLDISFESLSPKVTVSPAKLTVEPASWGSVNIRFDSHESGDFAGDVRVKTNDPAAEDFILRIFAKVDPARVTDYVYEDCEAGGPNGWKLDTGMVNTGDYGGYNGSSRSLYTWSLYCLMYPDYFIGFKTHYVRMGDYPSFSCKYRLFDSSMYTGDSKFTAAEKPKIVLYGTSDFGATWDELYVVEPGGEHEHKPVADWQEISLSIPSYAGKTCRFRLAFTHANGNPSEMQTNSYAALVDDIKIGSPVSTEVKSGYLYGEGIMETGKEWACQLNVENQGKENIQTVDVKLINSLNNEVLANASVRDLQSGHSQSVQINWTPSKSGNYTLHAEVSAQNDADMTNNKSNPVYLAVLPEGNKTVVVDHGTAYRSMVAPVNFYGVETESQSIFLANEIGMTKGTIGSITIYPEMESDYMSESFEVFIGETMKDDFSDGLFMDCSKMQKVFEGPCYFTPGYHGFAIPFNIPFEYNGGNIIVSFRKIGKEFINSKYFRVHSSSTPRNINTKDNAKSPTINYLYPQLGFNFVPAESGSVSGIISDSHGVVPDADVCVAGTRMHVLSDKQGRYSLKGICKGQHNLSVTRHGYYSNTNNPMNITTDNVELNIQMKRIPLYNISGVVREAGTSRPVEGAKVSLKGYDDFVTHTDAEGRYRIENVRGEENFNYTMRVTDGYHEAYARTIEVKKDINEDMEMKERCLPPRNVTASNAEDGVQVTWEQPLPEMRHDSGVTDGSLGYPTGTREVILGSAFREEMVLEEIGFFISSKDGKHSELNVIILGLDNNGNPDGKNILYADYNINYTDETWNRYVLKTPLKTDGCLIALSASGFLGIGTTGISETYPLEPGMHYYAGESFASMGIFDIANSSIRSHLMIRAYGYDVDGYENPNHRVVRTPSNGYDVYRFTTDSPSVDSWTKLGNSVTTGYLDSSVTGDNIDKIRYAVKGVYDGRSSETSISGQNYSGILNVDADKFFQIVGNSIIAEKNVRIFTIDGLEVEGDNLASGIYIVTDGIYFVKVQIR